MNNIDFRDNFKAFLAGEVRYKKLLATVNRTRDGRLLFWQERAIEKFCETHSISVPDVGQLFEIFGICEVHGNRLEMSSVKVFSGEIDYSRTYSKAREEFFPNSYLNEINGPYDMWGEFIEVRVCQACHKAEVQWQAND